MLKDGAAINVSHRILEIVELEMFSKISWNLKAQNPEEISSVDHDQLFHYP